MRIRVPDDFAAHAHELSSAEWAAKLDCSKNAVLTYCRTHGLKTAGIRTKPPFPFPDDFRETVQVCSVRATAKHYGATVKDVTAHCRQLGIDLSWKKGGSKKGEKRKKCVPKYETQEMIQMCLSCGEAYCDDGICRKIREAWELHLQREGK